MRVHYSSIHRSRSPRRANVRGSRSCGRHNAFVVCLLALVASAVEGCGSSHPATYPVAGKVAFEDGTPLRTGGIVMFESVATDEQPKMSAAGLLTPDGSFQLSTFKEGDGAVAGKHRALIRPQRKTENASQFSQPASSPIDPKFERFETSNLTFNVEQNNNEIKIVVTRPRT
jgi:hypothetical protein